MATGHLEIKVVGPSAKEMREVLSGLAKVIEDQLKVTGLKLVDLEVRTCEEDE